MVISSLKLMPISHSLYKVMMYIFLPQVVLVELAQLVALEQQEAREVLERQVAQALLVALEVQEPLGELGPQVVLVELEQQEAQAPQVTIVIHS